MRVYHGSLYVVENPEIRESSRTLDYGYGFYTTTDFEQARRWVARHRADGAGLGYVNTYNIDKVDIFRPKFPSYP